MGDDEHEAEDTDDFEQAAEATQIHAGLAHNPAPSRAAFGLRQEAAAGQRAKWLSPSASTGASEPVLIVFNQATLAPHERQFLVAMRAAGTIAQGGHCHVSPELTTYSVTPRLPPATTSA